jgi:ATP-binding cassette subfamily C protein LapB
MGVDVNSLSPSSVLSERRESLSLMLSRLAALQGQAVPVHRFSMLEHSRDGADLDALGPVDQALEMWLSRFPQAQASRVVQSELERGDFPLVWLPLDRNEGPYIVRGRLSGGGFSVEDVHKGEHERSASQMEHGDYLKLCPDVIAGGAAEGAPKTATDWFVYAIRKHRSIFFEAVFAALIVSLLGLFTSMYTMQVYDRVVPTQGYSTLWVLTIGVSVSILLEFILKQVRAHMVDRASKAIDIELSGVFFGKALDIRMDARPATVGTFASQIRHFESVRNFMTSSAFFILADAPFALAFIGLIAIIAGPVALVPLITIPLALISALIFQGVVERLTGAHMAESNRKNGLLIEAIDGIESVKACGGEWKMLDRYSELTRTIAGNEIDIKNVNTRAANLAQGIQQLNYVFLIVVGVHGISSGSLTTGGLIACSIIAGRAFGPLTQLPSLVLNWSNAKIALKGLDSIMEMPSDRDASVRLVVPQACDGELRMDKATFGYLKEKPSLDVPRLVLRPGERVAVMGSVGSGKSTLIKLLSGLYKPHGGQIFLDNVDMDHLAPEFLREHIGYLPQDVRLFSGTLRENITLGLPTPSDSHILSAAALTGLAPYIQAHPKGLELMITEGGRGLSGGQRQLVGLTRMLLARPRILLLDEPTASMDAQLEAQVMKHLFEEMPKHSSVVVVTHKMGVLPYVDRILVIDGGRIVLDGPRDEVLARLKQAQMQLKSRTPSVVQAGQAPAAPKPSAPVTEEMA